jgi:hypothetical protein
VAAARRSDDPEVRARAAAALKGIWEAAARKAVHDCPEVTVKELGKMADVREYLKVSPTGEHVFSYINRNGKSIIVYDGKEAPPCDSFNFGAYSADGSQYRYEFTRAGQTFAAVAGEEDKAVPAEAARGEVRSPDGKRTARVVKGDDGQWVTFEGKEGPHYKSVEFAWFSPDGGRLAYWARNAAKEAFMVVEGTPYGPFKGVGSLVFSPDSKRFAFTAHREGKATVICDGKEGQAYDEAFYPIFSPDSKSMAYWTRTADFKTISIIWDETEVGRITGEPRMAFSPDSRQLAWGNYHGDVYLSREKGPAEPVTRGYLASSPVAFSPDSKHLTAAASLGGYKWNMVVDGQPLGEAYDAEQVMSFDSSVNGGFSLILDTPGFSANGRHVYGKGFSGPPGNVGKEVRKHFMVIDGVAWPAHEGLWIPTGLQNHAKKLRYIVRDGEQLRLVETAWPEPLSWPEAQEAAAKN